jgi:hypothetical protein
MNATDAEGAAVLVATAADVDESPNASAVIPSDSFLARQQEEAAKKGWERWPVPPQLPAEAELENMDARKKPTRLTGLQLSFVKRHQAMLMIFMATGRRIWNDWRLSAKRSSELAEHASTCIKPNNMLS